MKLESPIRSVIASWCIIAVLAIGIFAGAHWLVIPMLVIAIPYSILVNLHYLDYKDLKRELDKLSPREREEVLIEARKKFLKL